MNESDQYSSNEMQSLSQSELESRALINTASKLNYIREHWEEGKARLDEALDKNRRLWAIIASAMQEEDCPQPADVRQNILNLSVFIFKRTIDILTDPKPESLRVLIDINMNLAKGLNHKGVD
ncbi:MAG: flagellar biosynthesis regulator FlaF [Alphaproteobacteria bacterium]|nr:flagellar biosynthesis regulator FlaF [Alphaproteobacteria bacterium]